MAEILGLGITHAPTLMGPAAHMSRAFRRMLNDPGMAPQMKDRANWPSELDAEYGDDQGESAAEAHRTQVVAGFRRVRAALDEFNPDVVMIAADDQYENFREGGIPAYCVQAFHDRKIRPWKDGEQAEFANNNVWGESPDREIVFRGAHTVGRRLTEDLLNRGFDVAYAYEPQFEGGLAHAFLNSLLYLDWDRTGFDYPVLPLAVNCYGRYVISHRGRYPKLTESVEFEDLDPPSPQPWRTFDLGRAVARSFSETDLRVAIVASSSWSHGFLARRNNFLYPDIDSDRAIYAKFSTNRFEELRDITREEIEATGAMEFTNWVLLAGAAHEIGLEVQWSDLATSWTCNSNKCMAILR